MEFPSPATAALFRLPLPDILSSTEAEGKDARAIRQPFPVSLRRHDHPQARAMTTRQRPSASFMITESSGGRHPAKPP